MGSNGIWFLSQLILIDRMVAILRGHDIGLAVVTGIFYTACTITGSVSMHYISMRWIEKGKRRVGSA